MYSISHSHCFLFTLPHIITTTKAETVRDGMATDLNFRICPFPETKNLFIATAGSNHGFKFLPVIGQYVADMLEGKLGQEWVDLWKWKYGKIPDNFQNTYPWPVRDLSELTGWKGRNVPGAGKLPWTWSRL